MKKISIVFILGLAIMAGCKQKETPVASEKPVLAVSIEPQRKMLEALAGPVYEVVTLLPAGSNPESFEPSATQRLQAAKALAYFTLGTMPFENSLAGQIGQNGRVYNTSAGIVPVMDTHSHGNHSHSAPDPHVWASVKNAKVMISNMADALEAIDADNSALYKHRADSLIAVLDSLDSRIEQTLAQGNAKAFAVWHPSLSYFARDYGLNQISVGQESKEATPGQMAAVINEAKGQGVKAFFYQKEFDSRQAQSLNAEIGSRLIEISPLDYDWDKQLETVAKTLAQ